MPIQTGIDCRDAFLVQELTLAEISGGAYPYNLNLENYGVSTAVQASTREPGVGSFSVQTNKAMPVIDGCTRWDIRYKVRRCNPVGADCVDECPSGTPDPNPEVCYYPTLSPCISYQFSLKWDDYRCSREGRAEKLAEEIRDAYIALKTAVNNRFATQLISFAGNKFTVDCNNAVSSATTPDTIYLTNTDGSFNRLSMFPITNTYRRMGFDVGTPYIIGGDHIALFQESLRQGFTTQAPERPGGPSLGGVRIFSDYALDRAWADGDAHAFSFIPGTVHPVSWFKFADVENQYSSPTLVKRTTDIGAAFGDPGFRADLYVHVEECPDIVLHYKYVIHTDLIQMPDEAFSEACGFCWNGRLNWLLDCGTGTCADLLNVGTGFPAPAPPPPPPPPPPGP